MVDFLSIHRLLSQMWCTCIIEISNKTILLYIPWLLYQPLWDHTLVSGIKKILKTSSHLNENKIISCFVLTLEEEFCYCKLVTITSHVHTCTLLKWRSSEDCNSLSNYVEYFWQQWYFFCNFKVFNDPIRDRKGTNLVCNLVWKCSESAPVLCCVSQMSNITAIAIYLASFLSSTPLIVLLSLSKTSLFQ